MSDNEISDNEDYTSDNDDNDNETPTNINNSKKLLTAKKIDYGADIEDDEDDDADSEIDESKEIDETEIEDGEDDNYYDDTDDSEAGGLDSDSENENEVNNNKSKSKNDKPKKNISSNLEDDDDDDDDDDDEKYLQKFDADINKNYILDTHPECLQHNYDEITSLSRIVRDKDNIIIDPLHKTIPFLTKYERARILGQRAKQIESGAKPLVKVPENIIDGYIIAELELSEKKIPFVIKRPLPDGSCEYWNIKDLELIIY